MKKLFLANVFCFLIVLPMLAQDLSTNVAVRNCVFYHPVEGNYLETYFSISAHVLKFHPTKNNQFQAGVEVNIVVMDGSTVAAFDKYYLYSPAVDDTTNVNFSILEQKRLSIPDKPVSVEILVSDMNNKENKFSKTEALLPISNNGVQISDIQFVDSYQKTTIENAFTKNNFELQPYPIDFFPSTRNTMIFYGEIYQTEKNMSDEQFLVTFAIRSDGNDAQQTKFYQYAKFAKAPVVSFLKEFEIADLPSGNYNLIVEVRNKKNELITQKKTFIQRANKGAVNYYENIGMINTAGTFVDDYTEDQLNYFLDVIKPRANSDEAKLIASLTDRVEPEMKKKFLYNFWLERNIADPHAAFLEYLSLVKNANESFGTPSKPGYKTDRGRVYLEYGPPYDRIASASEPGAYPYEIWFYDKLPDKQTKIGFAFYEPSLVTNDYILLHSNARGELQDPRWKLKIYESVASPQELHDLDNTSVGDITGGQRMIDIYDF